MIRYVDTKEVAAGELKTAYSTKTFSEGEQPLLHQEVTTVQQTTQPYFEVPTNNPLNSTHSISFPSSLPEPAATPAGSSATSSGGIIDPAAPAAPATSRFERELYDWWLPCFERAREFC